LLASLCFTRPSLRPLSHPSVPCLSVPFLSIYRSLSHPSVL
jgi:hypothetical protein